MSYISLYKVASKMKEILEEQKKEGKLNNFDIETIPDDNKIEIFMIYSNPIKSLKTTITVSRKDKDGDT